MAVKDIVAFDRTTKTLGGFFSVDELTLSGKVTFLQSISVPTDQGATGLAPITSSGILTAADIARSILEIDTTAGPVSVSLPSDASANVPVGQTVAIINIGTGVLTVDGEAGTTVNGSSSGFATVSVQFGGAPVYKQGANTWVVVVK